MKWCMRQNWQVDRESRMLVCLSCGEMWSIGALAQVGFMLARAFRGLKQ